jgi:hypothetical protein
MMMQMLAAGGLPVLTDGVRAADEDNPRGYYEFEPVKRTKRDRRWLDGAAGKAVKMVHQLLCDLPTDRPYQVVLMRRAMPDVLRSQAAMLARSGRAGSKLPPARLGRAFARQMTELVGYLGRHPCFALMEVQFEAVVRDPKGTAEMVARFLGARLDTVAMAAAVEPALHRQRSGTWDDSAAPQHGGLTP